VQQGQSLHVTPEHRYDRQASIVIAICGLFLCGVPTLIAAALVARYLDSERTWREQMVFVCLSSCGAFLAVWLAPTLMSLYGDVYRGVVVGTASVVSPSLAQVPNPLGAYLILSVLTLPLAGMLGGGMDAFNRLRKALRLANTVEEWQAMSDEFEARRAANLEARARTQANHEPEQVRSGLLIGTKMHGESLPHTKKDDIGIHQRRNWVVLDDWLLNEHMFVLGATGAGKSTYLKRLCAEVLKNTERSVFVIDGKGEEELAQDIRALVWKYRGQDTPIFRMGGETRGQSYNPFSGTAEAVYNRLLAMVRVSVAEGNAEYYADANRDLLSLVCGAPGGPPRSLEEVRSRLTLKWLRDAYVDDPQERSYIAELDEERVHGLLVRVLPFIREMRSYLRPDGFSLEKTSSAIFSIRALSVGDTAQRFCRFLIEDVKDFVATRTQSSTGGLLCIDEFGVFGNDNVTAVLSQARSKGYGVVLATQDYSNLGEERQAQSILSNTLTKVLMGTDYPEALGMTAGTKLQVESSMQSNEQGPTGMMSGRIQHAFKVDMNTARRFQRGQSFVIRKGYAIAVQVSPVAIPEEERAALPPEVAAEGTPSLEPVHENPTDKGSLGTPPVQPQKRRRGGHKL
jgi:energy-coupling factor transporter ATP-binding protein EcfA2